MVSTVTELHTLWLAVLLVTVHFQQLYYAEELPIAQLEKIQGDIGMAG